jgi:hypothetical protein
LAGQAWRQIQVGRHRLEGRVGSADQSAQLRLADNACCMKKYIS